MPVQDSLDVSGGASVGRTRIPMPWPFKRRPGLGARVLVQANFNRVAKTVCEELSSWITENRPRTGALLRTMLVYQEDHAMTQLHRMLPAFQMVRCTGRGPPLSARPEGSSHAMSRPPTCPSLLTPRRCDLAGSRWHTPQWCFVLLCALQPKTSTCCMPAQTSSY